MLVQSSQVTLSFSFLTLVMTNITIKYRKWGNQTIDNNKNDLIIYVITTRICIIMLHGKLDNNV